MDDPCGKLIYGTGVVWQSLMAQPLHEAMSLKAAPNPCKMVSLDGSGSVSTLRSAAISSEEKFRQEEFPARRICD